MADAIFDAYPSQQDTETETGGLWDAVQMGSSGAFYFLRLNIRR
jgi:iron complex outermembrane receptor protein